MVCAIADALAAVRLRCYRRRLAVPEAKLGRFQPHVDARGPVHEFGISRQASIAEQRKLHQLARQIQVGRIRVRQAVITSSRLSPTGLEV